MRVAAAFTNCKRFQFHQMTFHIFVVSHSHFYLWWHDFEINTQILWICENTLVTLVVQYDGASKCNFRGWIHKLDAKYALLLCSLLFSCVLLLDISLFSSRHKPFFHIQYLSTLEFFKPIQLTIPWTGRNAICHLQFISLYHFIRLLLKIIIACPDVWCISCTVDFYRSTLYG